MATCQPVLTDEGILAAVEDAMRKLGEGRGSLNAVGEDLIRKIIGLPHGAPPRTDTGD